MNSPFANLREEVRARVAVGDLLAAHGFEVGADHKSRCPKHDDQGKPNLHVYEDHVYCFRCRWHADAFGLIEHLQGLSHVEAVKSLAHAVGLNWREMKPADKERLDRERRSSDALNQAADYYATKLTDEQRKFLLKRGLTPEQIAAVGFGSTDGRLHRELLKRFTVDELCTPPGAAKVGDQWLATRSRREDELVDFLWAGMITIPVRRRGRVVGMVARRVDGKDPKYVNLPGPRSPFGIDAVQSAGDVVLVEGPFDALALERHGHVAVALMGISLNGEVLSRLTNCDVVHVMLDGDPAGASAAVNVARRVGKAARIVTLPEGSDPDDLSAEDLSAALAAGRDLVQHLIAQIDPALRATALVERIDEVDLVGALAEEDETRREGHFEDLRGHLKMSKADFGGLRSSLKKRAVRAEKEKEEGEVRQQSAVQWKVLRDGRMLDVVLGEDRCSTALAVYDPRSDTVEVCKTLDVGDLDLVAQTDSEVTGTRGADLFHPEAGRSVLLHEGPLEYGTEAALFADVQAHIKRYFEEPDQNWLDVMTAYVFFTWAVEFASDCPYMSWTGVPGSGKTRAMQVVGLVCRRPMILSIGSSPAALRRTVDRWRGTLLADEGLTTDKTDAGLAVLQMILSGFSRMTAVVQICDGENNDPRSYYIYGPKLFTGQIDFRDEGARSRTLKRTLVADQRRKDQPVDLPPVFESESETLRRKLQLWRFRVLSAELRRRTGGGDGLDRSAAFAEQLRGVSSRVQQVFLPMLRAVSDPDVQGRLIVVAQTHARDFIESKRLRTEGVAMQAVAELMAETGGRAPRATSEGRIRLADVRKRMIEFAVADGGDQRAAEKSVPNSRTLSAVFKGVLSLAVGRDRRGAFLVVACEEDLRRVETAMTNLGVDLPWSAASVPLASPDSDGEQPIADAVPPGLAGVARPLRPSDNGRATHVDDDYLPSPTAEDAEAGFIVDPEVDAS